MSKHLLDIEPLRSESPARDFFPHEDSECFLCERGMAESAAGCWVEMTTSGKLVSKDIPDEERAGLDSQGCFPVGSRCTKRVPKEFRITPEETPDRDEFPPLSVAETLRYKKLKHLAEVVHQATAKQYSEFLRLNTRYLKNFPLR